MSEGPGEHRRKLEGVPMNDVARLTKEQAARFLDYSLVTHPEWQDDVFLRACEATRRYRFGGFYVLPFCRENEIEVGTGIGFPFGAHTTKSKLAEAKEMIQEGTTALDMVANVAALKDKKYGYYRDELRQFASLCRDHNVVSKAVLRIALLSDEEIKVATRIVAESGVGYAKTATGIEGQNRPNIFDVKLMLGVLEELSTGCRLKATSGQVSEVYAFIQAGAHRIGTSAGVEVVEALPMIQRTLFR
jgi:deoxyribose-phosphate aldolase